MMRLALLTHEPFYPPSGGGSAEAVYLVRELVRRGHEIHLFCPAFDRWREMANEFGITVHPFTRWPMGRYSSWRTPKYLLYPWFLTRQVLREAHGLAFDAVLSQHAISAVSAGRLKARLKVPVVMNFLDYLSGFMETWPSWAAPRPMIRALERFEISLPTRYQADGVMTVSDPLADHFAAAGMPRDRLQPIYYGYDAEKFRPIADDVPLEDPPVVVMHGSFDRHHLGPVAFEALRTVAATRPDVTFRFVGLATPTLEAFCARVRSHLPHARLECPGFVPYDQTAMYLNRAAVGIVPYEESTGVHCAFVAKIVEYLGVGMPVVSTALRSASSYFDGEPAVVFAGFDGPRFGEAILTWLQRPIDERRSLGRTASQRVTEDLDWGVVCRRAAEFVERTISGNS
jgi:glycosyltransferase involved in cell wall biosynthesis